MTDQHRFKVLGLVSLRLPEPWLWLTEDMNEENAIGAVFHCFEDGHETAIGYLMAADISGDPDEPNIADFKQQDVPQLDQFLEQEIRKSMSKDGRQMVRWMSSNLNEIASNKGLVTAYIALDRGKERQYIDVRIPVRNRKVIVAGCFDIAKAGDLARPIFAALGDITILASP